MHDFMFFIAFAFVEIEFIADDDEPMFFEVVVLALEVAVALSRDEIFVSLTDVTETFNDIILVMLLQGVHRAALIGQLDRRGGGRLLVNVLG